MSRRMFPHLLFGAVLTCSSLCSCTERGVPSPADAAVTDQGSGAPADEAAPLPDATAADQTLAAASDLAEPTFSNLVVEIDIDRACRMTLAPATVVIHRPTVLKLTYHNSSTYAIDIKTSFGRSVMGLAPGATWTDSVSHCGPAAPEPLIDYADLSAPCAQLRLMIHCI